jgi:hypothetical protein
VSARLLRISVLLAGVLLASGTVACDPGGLHAGEDTKPYPHQGPSDLADVSLEQALSHYRLRLPEAVKDISYGALRATDGYPFGVEFSMPCEGVPAFASANKLAHAGKETPSQVRVEAMEAGFALDDTPAYVRAKGSKLPKVAGAVFERSGTCRIFLGS